MIKLPGYFTGFSSKADGSASLRFATQEISAEEFANLENNTLCITKHLQEKMW